MYLKYYSCFQVVTLHTLKLRFIGLNWLLGVPSANLGLTLMTDAESSST